MGGACPTATVLLFEVVPPVPVACMPYTICPVPGGQSWIEPLTGAPAHRSASLRVISTVLTCPVTLPLDGHTALH